MTDISKADAKALAVEYAAYTRDVVRSDQLGILFWGEMLLETQERLGIDMVGVEAATTLINAARAARKAAA